MKKNILITGGNGFIGSHIIFELFKDKNYIMIIKKRSKKIFFSKLNY